jgi:hypothetical protein
MFTITNVSIILRASQLFNVPTADPIQAEIAADEKVVWRG